MQSVKTNRQRVIFLDLDGPVLDGKFRHYNCYRDIVIKYGGVPIDIDAYWDMKRSMIKRDVLLKKSKFTDSYENFFNEWMTLIETPDYLKFDQLKPNVIDTLKMWKEHGFKIVLVTMRQNRINLIRQLQEINVFSILDEVIDASPLVKNTKSEALKNYSFLKAILIGDTEEDAKAARNLSIPFVGITNGLRERALLEADFYFEEIWQIDLSILENL